MNKKKLLTVVLLMSVSIVSAYITNPAPGISSCATNGGVVCSENSTVNPEWDPTNPDLDAQCALACKSKAGSTAGILNRYNGSGWVCLVTAASSDGHTYLGNMGTTVLKCRCSITCVDEI